MATATAAGSARTAPAVVSASRRRRRALNGLIIVVGVVVVWEGLKFLGGTPWRAPGALPGSPVLWNPPFRWPFVNDLNLPHIWNIGLALLQPWQRGAQQNLLQYLVTAALFSWREAGLGFLLGAALGLGLATLFVHARLLERALVPYVIASQTIPIVALAPLIAFAFGQGVVAVVIIATYLTFFPVTIAMIRGLRSFDPRAMELMRSYAASRPGIYWKLRLPSSLPYLFTALKIAATASIVGAIVGEGPGQIIGGLGAIIVQFNSYYITGPEKLWAAVLVTAALGLVFYGLVRLVELLVLRGRPEVTA
jgi:NitT/TauT family transport system permease protein